MCFQGCLLENLENESNTVTSSLTVLLPALLPLHLPYHYQYHDDYHSTDEDGYSHYQSCCYSCVHEVPPIAVFLGSKLM